MTETLRTWTVSLPWPSPILRDNDRLHWRVKAQRTAELRRDMALIARSDKLPRGLGRVLIVLCWRPATRRRRDQLSIAPTLKPLVDGLVDYGLVADDDIDHVRLECQILPVRGPSATWLEITELEAS